MNKIFTIDLWKKCLGDIYDKVPVRRFFSYIDIIQVFIDDESIFLFAPNSHVKVIVDRYYYNHIVRSIIKFTGDRYKIEFKVGMIYIDDDRKFSIKAKFFESINLNHFENNVVFLNGLRKRKKFFINVYINDYLTVKHQKDLMLTFYKNGFTGIKTNLHFLLKNEKKINNVTFRYDILFLIEKKHDCEFYLLLNQNIDKIKMFIENNNIIFISKISLDLLKERFLKIG